MTVTDWADSLRRWQAFWAGDLYDRPPVIAHPATGEELDVGEPPSLERILARYDPARNGEILAHEERAALTRAVPGDDTPPALLSGGGVFFTGAVFGAPVRLTADVITCEPILANWADASQIDWDPDNPWVRRALALADQLVARSRGRYAITPGLLEGPSDICANLRGPTRLAEDLYASPRQVQSLARKGADGWLAYAQAMFERVPLFYGGTVTQWSVWTPGRGAALQEDFCTLVSPDTYRRFFGPLDRELAESVDTLWAHVHAGAVHLVEPLLEIEAVRGIQIVYDGVVSPPLERLLVGMQAVQRSGRCLILRKFTLDDLAAVLPHLVPQRLALDVYLSDGPRGRDWIAGLCDWPGRA